MWCLLIGGTGGRDKRGGAILTFLANQTDRLKYEQLKTIVTYLASLPRSVIPLLLYCCFNCRKEGLTGLLVRLSDGGSGFKSSCGR